MATVVPTCLSMIVCHEVVLDLDRGRLSILGVVHEIRCPRFPWTQPRLTIWGELSGGRGLQMIDILALWVASSRTSYVQMATHQAPARFRHPIRSTVVGARFDNLDLPEPGEIVFQMALAGSVIMERRVHVVLVGDEA